MSPPVYIHANALVIEGAGILIRGPSRAGKSALTLALIARAEAMGRSARLVGDDRVSVEAQNGEIIARPHPRIAGMIEQRGVGILTVPHEPECVLRLVIDLGERGENVESAAKVAGIMLPRIVENAFDPDCPLRICEYIQEFATF